MDIQDLTEDIDSEEVDETEEDFEGVRSTKKREVVSIEGKEVPPGEKIESFMEEGDVVTALVDGEYREFTVAKNGSLLWRGAPIGGRRSGGRISKPTREMFLQAAGRADQDYEELRDTWLNAARENLMKGKFRTADLCQRRADAIQSGYIEYGMGKRTTTVIQNPELIEKIYNVTERFLSDEDLKKWYEGIKSEIGLSKD